MCRHDNTSHKDTARPRKKKPIQGNQAGKENSIFSSLSPKGYDFITTAVKDFLVKNTSSPSSSLSLSLSLWWTLSQPAAMDQQRPCSPSYISHSVMETLVPSVTQIRWTFLLQIGAPLLSVHATLWSIHSELQTVIWQHVSWLSNQQNTVTVTLHLLRVECDKLWLLMFSDLHIFPIKCFQKQCNIFTEELDSVQSLVSSDLWLLPTGRSDFISNLLTALVVWANSKN